jgi:hypothetical protein
MVIRSGPNSPNIKRALLLLGWSNGAGPAPSVRFQARPPVVILGAPARPRMTAADLANGLRIEDISRATADRLIGGVFRCCDALTR